MGGVKIFHPPNPTTLPWKNSLWPPGRARVDYGARPGSKLEFHDGKPKCCENTPRERRNVITANCANLGSFAAFEGDKGVEIHNGHPVWNILCVLTPKIFEPKIYAILTFCLFLESKTPGELTTSVSLQNRSMY